MSTLSAFDIVTVVKSVSANVIVLCNRTETDCGMAYGAIALGALGRASNLHIIIEAFCAVGVVPAGNVPIIEFGVAQT
jgi:hypothetical protein